MFHGRNNSTYHNMAMLDICYKAHSIRRVPVPLVISRTLTAIVSLVCCVAAHGQESHADTAPNLAPDIREDETRLKIQDGNFVAVPIPMANPILDAGLIAGAAYFYPQTEEQKKQQPASVTGLAGMYTTNESWALGGFHESIGDVRGSGFFLGLELVEKREQKTPATSLTRNVVNGLRDRGLLTGSIGPDANTLKLRCPMVFSRDNADHALEIIDRVLPACR